MVCHEKQNKIAAKHQVDQHLVTVPQFRTKGLGHRWWLPDCTSPLTSKFSIPYLFFSHYSTFSLDIFIYIYLDPKKKDKLSLAQILNAILQIGQFRLSGALEGLRQLLFTYIFSNTQTHTQTHQIKTKSKINQYTDIMRKKKHRTIFFLP